MYSFSYMELTATKNPYKCVARFVGENAPYETIQIFTNEAVPSVNEKMVTITSTEGNIFYNGQGKPTLEVKLNGNLENLTYYYIWKVKNKDGENKIYYPGDTDAIITNWIEDRDIIINSAAIDESAIFECYVYDSNEDFFNSSIIEITNSMESSSPYFNIAIENGNQVFTYNKYNLSPTHASLKFSQEILPLKFTFSDDQGLIISYDKIIANDENGNPYGSVKWCVPTDKTLIKVNSDIIEGDYYIIKNSTLFFSIADDFDLNCNNNTIILEIEYQDTITKKEINLTFLKDNDMLDNGTDTYLKEIYRYGDNVLLSYFYINGNSTTMYHRNSHLDTYCEKSAVLGGATVNLFSAEMWKNHKKITPDNIKWMVLDSSNSIFSESNGGIKLSGNRIENTSPTNVLRGVVTKFNQKYFIDIPVTTINMYTLDYQIALKLNTGYQKVKYDRNGKNPSYDNTKPFEIVVGNSFYITQEPSLFTYTWELLGDKQGLFIVEDANLKNNQKRISPMDSWLGDTLNTAVLVTVYKDGAKIGDIHIPIIMYLDRMDTESLASWDGNYIVNDNEKFLTPIGYESVINEDGFSGIFLGRIQSDNNVESGLFSYDAGMRVLNADSLGSIYIGPKSDAYIGASAAGLEIKYINDNFTLDKNGIIQNLTLGDNVVIVGENISDAITFDDENATGLGKVLYDLKSSIESTSGEGFDNIQQNYVTKLLFTQTIEDLENSINETNQKFSNYALTEDIYKLLGITDINSTSISPSSIVIGTNLIVDDNEDAGLQTIKVTANDYYYNQKNVETGEVEILSLLDRIAMLEAEIDMLKNGSISNPEDVPIEGEG